MAPAGDTCAEVITAFALMTRLFPSFTWAGRWLFFWVGAVSQQPDDLAELPLASGGGTFRHLHLPHRQLLFLFLP